MRLIICKLITHCATEISVGDWKEFSNNKFERAIKFCSQVSDQVILKKLTGGISPVLHEKKDYEFVEKALHVCSIATSSAGGFNCATTTDYTITDLLKNAGMANGHSDGCHVDIVVKSEFKSRLFKGQVESMMNQQATQTFDQWLVLVKTKISEFHKEEQLRLRQKHAQPLPIPDYLTDAVSSSPSTTENSEYDTDDDSYYDATDHLTSPPISRTNTPTPIAYRSITPPPPTSTATSIAPPSTTTLVPGSLSALVQSMHKELQQVRSMTEVNSSRLLGLEASKATAPSSTSSSAASSTSPLSNNEGLLPYLQRLDILVKQQEEESQRNRDKEQEWRRRVEEMEAKMEGMGGKGRLVPGGWWGMVVFLIVWPVVAQKFWKYAKILHPMVAQVFWRM